MVLPWLRSVPSGARLSEMQVTPWSRVTGHNFLGTQHPHGPQPHREAARGGPPPATCHAAPFVPAAPRRDSPAHVRGAKTASR